MKLVECVPNFSEGRDRRVIDTLVAAVSGVAGARVLDVDPGADTNRTVLTFVAPPEVAVEAAFQLIRKAGDLIDMRRHHGAHPRHGAVDVCPFVPVSGVTMDTCVDLARTLGRRVGEELRIPVYLYEHAASSPERRNLARVRKGEYEALPQKLVDPDWKPDFGPAEWNDRVARTGVVTIGAREFLIAYNVNLNTRDKRFATDIAFELREKGRSKRTGDISPDYFRGEIVRYYPSKGIFPCGPCDFIADSFDALARHYDQEHQMDFREFLRDQGQDAANLEGRPVKKPGRFKHCKATGWVIEDYGCAQITVNLTNYHVTPPHVFLEACRELAARRGLVVTGSEIVGLVPFDALLEAGTYYQARYHGPTGLPWQDLVRLAIRSMKLDDVAPFDLEKKVLGLPERPDECLMALPARDFVDEVSRESPAPGGGSIAALAGALGAALASMVANLTVGKEGYEGVWKDLDRLAARAQRVKDRLVRSVDTDTDAFNAVLEAMRMPQGTAAEREARHEAIQQGYKEASQVPLETARACFEALELAGEVARKGNAASVTDAGVGALMAAAGVESAVYNVKINLPSIEDEAFRDSLSATLDGLVADAHRLRDDVRVYVLEKLG